jgi:hypothetical protein
MALERAREYLCTFHTKAYAIILNGRKRGLRNTGPLGQLILAQTLQLTNDAHRLTDRDAGTLPRWTKLTH